MEFGISRVSGWKRTERESSSKFGFARNHLTLTSHEAVSILAAYDTFVGRENQRLRESAERTFSAVLLKRAQMLQ